MILVLEDDQEIRDMLAILLKTKGYEVQVSSNVKEFDSIWEHEKERFDLLLLDVKLPDGNGFAVCENVRNESTIPIIFITSYDDEESIVKGLDIGGDDYITKPFHNAELISRINANLRQRKRFVENVYSKGDIKILFDRYKVMKCGEALNISTNEFNIIKLLVENRGLVVKRDIIYEKIWDIKGNFVEYNTLTVTMSRIKAKLGTFDGRNSYIETIRNVGYRWID